MPTRRIALFAVLFACACGSSPPRTDSTTSGGQSTEQPASDDARPAANPASEIAAYVAAQVDAYRPLRVAASLAWYESSASGSDEDFARSKEAESQLNRFLADPERFARIRQLHDGKAIADPLLARQVEIFYLGMLGKQVDAELLAEITGLEKEVEQLFNAYRGTVAGKTMSQNQIEAILDTSTDSRKLRQAWEAQKDVGRAVAPKLLALVELRNQVAQKLGFRDFYAMRLAESELDETELLATFDELDELTREPFLKAKATVDARLAKRLRIATKALMPWHYQNPFFQEPPNVFNTGLDAIYKTQDTLALCRRFYEGIGLDLADIIERSDLYEKPGKTPHAFATDIDREGDIRVLANIVPGLRWQSTMVHELGHAVYDKYIASKLPWLLREVTHPMTTEGMAMMLERPVTNPLWAEAMGIMTAAQAKAAMAEARAYQAFAALQFSRWTQVMLRFEREMYRDPKQDLNKLWWDLVERYQGLHRPPGRVAPDYASKVHLVVAPVYYQNYMLGELFAAQVHEAIASELGTPPETTIYVGDTRVGQFLQEKVFGPGSLYRWDELTRRATGNALSAAAFARRFQAAGSTASNP